MRNELPRSRADGVSKQVLVTGSCDRATYRLVHGSVLCDNKPFYFKNIIFVFSILLLFANISPIRAEEKATQGDSAEEILNCIAKVKAEFDPPVDECLEKHRNRYWECDKIANKQNEAILREVERRCAVPEDKSPSSIPTITVQPTVSSQARREVPGYTQALVAKPPKASDFQKIPQSDFTIVSPAGKAPATQKLATESASIKDSIFIGKIGDKGEVVVETPDGERISLTDDRSGYNLFNNRFGATVPGPQMGNPTQLKIDEVDCHLIASRNDNGNCDSSGKCRYPDIWDVQTRITKTVGDCTYTNEAAPVRVLVEPGNATFKTLGGVAVTAENTDFGIGYDAKSALSIVEIYNGSVTVMNKEGQSIKISTVYGSKINRIEVNKDGEMTEKIAIPQSQWEAFLASQEKKDETKVTTMPFLGVVTVLGLGGIVFFLYRKGKLIPLCKTLSQKVIILMKKTSKSDKEKETDKDS